MKKPKVTFTMHAKIITDGSLYEWKAHGEPDLNGFQQTKYKPYQLANVHVKGSPNRRAPLED